jgi:RND family efflux transporter MFP subunit
MVRTTSVLVLAALLAAATLAGCNRPAGSRSEPESNSAAARRVSVTSAQRKSLRKVVEQPGLVMAYEETQLFARVAGYVGKVQSDIGQKIRGPRLDSEGKEQAGDVLAELAVPEREEEVKRMQAQVRQAEAEVVQAEKALAAADAAITVAEAAVTEIRASYDRWASESKRMSRMAKRGVVEEQTSDEARKQFLAEGGRLTSAKATVVKTRADRDRAEADVRAVKARVDVARASTRREEALLGYAKIRAPYDGVVTMRKVNTGDFVQPAGGKGDFLFTVVRLDPVRIVVAVPEADADLVRDGSKATLSIPAVRERPFEGTVTRTSWALSPGARTLRAEVDLSNRAGQLRPGMYVQARIACQAPEAWVLPAAAVVKQGDVRVCFLIEGGKAVRTPVQIGHGDDKWIEVRRYQKAGTAWAEWTGKEQVAASAEGLTDGQAVERK